MSANIKTWQERANWLSDRPAPALMVEAMKAEIAELRAALANSEANLSQWQAIGENATDDLIRCVTSKSAALSATAPTVAVDERALLAEILRCRRVIGSGDSIDHKKALDDFNAALDAAETMGSAKLSEGVAITDANIAAGSKGGV